MKYQNITTNTTTTIASRSGTFVRIVVNKAVANSVTNIYDSLTGAGRLIGTITQPASPVNTPCNADYMADFQTGLTIVTSAADDLTIIWQ